jgi:hypothetical protein
VKKSALGNFPPETACLATLTTGGGQLPVLTSHGFDQFFSGQFLEKAEKKLSAQG